MDEIYALSEDGKVFIGLLDRSLKEFTIPEGVEKIGPEAFSDCPNLENIVIPNSVNTMYSDVFSCCSSLSSIVFPKGVKLWGKNDLESEYEENCLGCYAFYDCSSLISIVIPEGVKKIGEEAFSGCSSLISIVIPEGVEKIEEEAFSGCSSLTSMVIPEGVTCIGHRAFMDCSSLKNIIIPDSINTMYSNTFSGCSNLTSIVFPKGVKLWGQEFEGFGYYEENCLGAKAFSGFSSLKSIVIPEGVTAIGDGAFSGCSSLISIVIPEGVEKIGDEAFSGCSSLASIVIPEGVEEIRGDAFSGCSSLTSIVIPEGVTWIGYEAFSGCGSLTSIVIHEGVTSIGDRAFEGCTSLSSIQFPDSIKYIGDDALKDISIKSIEISEDGIRSLLNYREDEWCEDYEELPDFFFSPNFSKKLIYYLGSPRLDGMNYFLTDHGTHFFRYFGPTDEEGDLENKSFTIPDGVKKICTYAFSGSSLETVIFPIGVNSIDSFAFAGCKNLHTVVLLEGLVYIGERAFAGCSSLKKIVIPKSVKHIGDDAFDICIDFDPDPYSIVFTYKSKGKDLEVRTELPKFEINNDIDLSGALKGKQLIKDNDGEVLMSIYDNYDNNITKDLLLDRNLDIIANEDCSHTLYFEDVEVGFYMICGIDDEALGAELEACFKQRDKYKFLKLFNPYDYEFHEVLAGYDGGWDVNLNYRIYDENDNQIESGQKNISFKNIFKYTLNYEGDDCFKEVNTKYIVRCYDAYKIGMVPFPVPKDFNMDNVHFNDGRAFHRGDDDDRIDLTQIHYKGKVYEAVMDDIGDNGTYGPRDYYLFKKDENGSYEFLGSI